MQRTPVSSSTIAEIGYDPTTMTLEIAFLNGNVYQYFDVPDLVYQGIMGAESKGKYLHANIKNLYRYTQL